MCEPKNWAEVPNCYAKKAGVPRLIQGTVKTITPDYPYQVTMNNGVQFTSHFLFRAGARIRLHLSGDLFTHPWPQGFWHCEPNGMSTYKLSPKQVEMVMDKDCGAWLHGIPRNVAKAIIESKPQKWTAVESFYTYHYTATWNPSTMELSTNYAMRIGH